MPSFLPSFLRLSLLPHSFAKCPSLLKQIVPIRRNVNSVFCKSCFWVMDLYWHILCPQTERLQYNNSAEYCSGPIINAWIFDRDSFPFVVLSLFIYSLLAQIHLFKKPSVFSTFAPKIRYEVVVCTCSHSALDSRKVANCPLGSRHSFKLSACCGRCSGGGGGKSDDDEAPPWVYGAFLHGQ